MITGQQIIDAIAHADEWPDELQRLHAKIVQLEHDILRLEQERNAAQAKADFYYDAYISQQKRRGRK